jgi:hypothetical protein
MLHKMVDIVHLFDQHAPLLKDIGALAAALIALLKGGPTILDAWRTFLDRRYLVKQLGAKKYTPEQIRFATTYYIEPHCQDIDPAGAEDWRRLYAVKQNIFQAVDTLLTKQVQFRHTILLADSGMGKSSFVLNYYARHCRKFWSPFKLAVVPLGAADANELISAVPAKSETVIFLDAFDEDTSAINNHKDRLQELIRLTEDFRHVMITCRTQFFLKDDEIPRDVVGQMRFDPVDRTKTYVFHKLYLSPFSDDEVAHYLRRRFGLLRRKDRLRAEQICRKMGDLTARPLLLANVQYLVGAGEKEFRYSFQVYEELVKRWIERERPFVPDGDALWKFSEDVASDIYRNRGQRRSETIPYTEIERLARSGIDLKAWQLSGRSLLNRTADGDFKFAHRSILEYIYIRAFVAGRVNSKEQWTDLMKDFFFQYLCTRKPISLPVLEAPLEWMDCLKWTRNQHGQNYYLWAITTVPIDVFIEDSEPVGIKAEVGFPLHFQVIVDAGNRLAFCWVPGKDSENEQRYPKTLSQLRFGGLSDWRIWPGAHDMALPHGSRTGSLLFAPLDGFCGFPPKEYALLANLNHPSGQNPRISKTIAIHHSSALAVFRSNRAH